MNEIDNHIIINIYNYIIDNSSDDDNELASSDGQGNIDENDDDL